MRSLLTAFALLFCLLPSLTGALKGASTLKGVRGHKRLETAKRVLQEEKEKKEKKCKKYAPKAKKADPEAKKADPNSEKADPETETAGPKAKKELKATPAPKATEEAAECLEWWEDKASDSGEMNVPTLGLTGNSTSDFDSINVDCEAIANDEGPKDSHSVSFSVNIDVLKEADAKMSDIYSAMEKELQQKVAPRIAGCSSRRFLAEGKSKIVHVDFGEMEFDHQGCDSSLSKEAAEKDGVCMASDVPVDVYFVGDFPEEAIAKVEVAIEEHEWNVDGLLGTSEVAIVQTASTMDGEGGLPVGAIAGGVVAAVVAAGVAFFLYKRSQNPTVVAKAELDTDEESSDDEKHKNKVPEVQARAIHGM